MIVPMKKVSLVVLDKYTEEALLNLRAQGLVHIKYIQSPSSSAIDLLEKQIQDIQNALLITSRYCLSGKEEKYTDKADLLSLATQIISWNKQKQNCLQEKQNIESIISWYQDWGEFSISSLKELSKQGIYIRLYRCSKKELLSLSKTSTVEVIKRQGRIYYLAVVSLVDKHKINLAEVIPPDKELSALKKELKVMGDKIASLDNLLTEKANYRRVFENYLAQLKKSLVFNKVKSGMQEAGEVSCLQGFIPATEVAKLINLANRQGWAYLIQEPDNPQEVPTLIKNPRWLRIIEPVFKFMGTLPGYNELDISLTFLLFFSLFFALLISDAGYGLVFLLVTYFIRKRLSNAPGEPFMLMYVLGFATVIWGALSGTWFGVERIAQLPFFKTMVIGRVNSFIDVNQTFMMYLCFLIGAVHLTVAHSTIALRIINSLRALGQLGWILIIWSLFFIAARLVLARDLFRYTAVMFFLGIVLVLLFSHPQKKFFKGIVVSLADLPLRVINSFSDIISYLRLFAVGYATLAVASSFNHMASRIGFNNLLGGFIGALILFLGHGLNILLGLMAVIVHGIRLNMLEFSSHLGMQWSGIEYKPFRE